MKSPFSVEGSPFLSRGHPFGRYGGMLSIAEDGGIEYDFRDEFTTSLVSSALNTSACEPGPGTRTVTDTETCMSIIPNFGTALATQAGVTMGGSNNRSSYATGYSWLDFPTGFNAAAHAGAGRIVVMYDPNGRACWGWLGAASAGAETLGDERYTTANAASDPNANEANATTGWSATNSGTLTSDATVYSDGSYSIKLEVTTGNSGIKYSVSGLFTNGKLVKVSYKSRHSGTGGDIIFGLNAAANTGLNAGYNTILPTDTTFASRSLYYINNTGQDNLKLMENNAFNDGSAYLDNISVKQVLTPSLTGCWVYPTLAKAQAGDTAQSGWNKPSAFDMNAASYTFGVYQPSSGGRLFFQGGKAIPNSSDPMIRLGSAISRVAGLCIGFKYIMTSAQYVLFGADSSSSGAIDYIGFNLNNTTGFFLNNGANSPKVFTPTINTEYYLLLILRNSGSYAFIKTGSGNYKLIWSSQDGNTSPLYLGIGNHSSIGMPDFLRIPKTRWLPTPILSDSFAAADATSNDGRTADGAGHAETTGLGSGGTAAWSSPNGAIVGNRLVITPELGGELVADWDMEANNLTSWSTYNSPSVLEKNTNSPISGIRDLRIVASASGYSGACMNIPNLPGNFIRVSGSANVISGEAIVAYGIAFDTYLFNFSGSGTKTVTSKPQTSVALFLATRNSNEVRYDNISAKQITLSTCLTTNSSPLPSPDCEIKCVMYRTQTGIQQGIVFGLDSKSSPANFGLVYFDGSGNIKFDVCVAGTYTNLASVATTFTDGYELRVWQAVNASTGFREIHIYYNNTLIGSFVTLTAPQTTATNGLYSGLFSTYGGFDSWDADDFDSTDFSASSFGATFDNATLYATGSNNEFQILDRLIGA